MTANLGLIERDYPTDDTFDPHRNKSQWQRFEHYIRHLQRNSEEHVNYKLLYMGRHGQGVHNVAEEYYHTEAWDVSLLPAGKDPDTYKLHSVLLGYARRQRNSDVGRCAFD